MSYTACIRTLFLSDVVFFIAVPIASCYNIRRINWTLQKFPSFIFFLFLLITLKTSFFDRHLMIKTSDRKERGFDLSEVIFKLKESD